MGFRNIITNIKNRGLKDVTDPNRWKMYMEGQDIKKNGIHLEYDEILAFCEMVVYRYNQTGCQECVKSGSCSHCGCEVKNAFPTKDFYCSQGHFGPIPTQTIKKEIEGRDGAVTASYEVIDVEAWEQEKEEKGIKFKIEENK